MKNRNIVPTLFAILLVFLISGCGNTNQTATKPAADDARPTPERANNTTPVEDATSMEKESTTSFLLKVDATNGQAITFSWEIPEEMAKDAEKFMFLRSTDPNPTYPTNWYWWRGPDHRSLTWEGLPTGTAHFRVCVMSEEECMQYSNDVEVTLE
ncbi:hypothetical protein H6758_04695 [Candidatus Nomurabacteria bacterium]|nr:hypothetical protein [Candidatus Nomurabacteria bacterium]